MYFKLLKKMIYAPNSEERKPLWLDKKDNWKIKFSYLKNESLIFIIYISRSTLTGPTVHFKNINPNYNYNYSFDY